MWRFAPSPPSDAQNTQISDYEAAIDLLVKQYRLAMLGGEPETLMPPSSGMGMSHRTWTNRAVWVNVYHGNLALAIDPTKRRYGDLDVTGPNDYK